MSKRKKIENEIVACDQIIQAVRLKVRALACHIRLQQNDLLEETFTHSTQQINHNNSVVRNILKDTFDHAYESMSNVCKNSGLPMLPWSPDNVWADLNSPIKTMPPEYLRIGELTQIGLQTNLPEIPAILPLVKSNHVLVFHPRDFSSTGSALLSSISWRISAETSPKNYRFTFIDSIDRGRNFASFLSLPESVRGNKIICQSREIEEVLQRAVDDMEDIIQRRLRETYDTIEDYNASNIQTAVPYHFIIFTALPDGFSEAASELLAAIARTGIRAGYYLIGGIYTGEVRNYNNLLPRLMEQSACISVTQSGVANWDDPAFAQFSIKLDSSPSKTLIELISSLTEEAINSISNIVEFPQISPEISNWMQSSSQFGLAAPVGVDQNGKPFDIQFGPNSDTFHSIVAGRIGSGKTNFLHALILSLCLRYSDEELNLYLVDFKEGVEFQDYALYQLPHARAIVIEAEREFGLSILQFLVNEMERRSEEFKLLGANVVNIEDYRSKTNKAMPRIVAIMDEFVKLFEEYDAISDQAYQLLLSIVQRSRAFGIHLILAAQRPVGSFQNLNPVKSQIGLRVGFKCNDPDDSSLILGDRNEKAAYLDKYGLAYITYEPTMPEKSTLVKIAFVGREDRKLYLEAIREYYRQRYREYKWDALLFTKWQPIFWNVCKAIKKNLEKLVIYSEPIIWLGQPVHLAEDQTITFVPQEKENVILLGADENLAFQTLVHSLLGIALTVHPDQAELHWLSATNRFQNATEYIREFKEIIPHSLEIYSQLSIHNTLTELVERLERRKNQKGNNTRIFLFIPGVHRISVLNDSISDSPTNGELLEKLIKEGPMVGIHTIAWSDRYETLRNITSFSVLDYFNHRIAFHMSIDDSNSFLGISEASVLGTDKRLIYRNQRWEERTINKIKPYTLPNIGAFREILDQIKQRWE